MNEKDMEIIIRTVIEEVLKHLGPFYAGRDNNADKLAQQQTVKPFGQDFRKTDNDHKRQHLDKRLITENDVKDIHKAGIQHLTVPKKTIITPLALEVLKDKKITLVKE